LTAAQSPTDGGALLLREAERLTGIISGFAACPVFPCLSAQIVYYVIVFNGFTRKDKG